MTSILHNVTKKAQITVSANDSNYNKNFKIIYYYIQNVPYILIYYGQF
jgi:hypothetical protein